MLTLLSASILAVAANGVDGGFIALVEQPNIGCPDNGQRAYITNGLGPVTDYCWIRHHNQIHIYDKDKTFETIFDPHIFLKPSEPLQ